MKKYLIILLTLICFSVNAQVLSAWTDIDTLETFDNKVLVYFKVNNDSILKEEAQAFLYLITIEDSRFKVFPNLFKRETVADSIVFHGLRKIYLKNGYNKIEKHNEGELVSKTFFNQSGIEISEQEFNQNNLIIGPCGDVTGNYFLHGRKMKKN